MCIENEQRKRKGNITALLKDDFYSPCAAKCCTKCPPPARPGAFRGIGEIVVANNPDGDLLENSERSVGSRVGIEHVDIYYNNAMVYQGAFGGLTIIHDSTSDLSKKSITPLEYNTSGNIGHGYAAGIPCKCASDKDILDCLKTHPSTCSSGYHVITNSCQIDVQAAITACCLTGYIAVWNRMPRKPITSPIIYFPLPLLPRF